MMGCGNVGHRGRAVRWPLVAGNVEQMAYSTVGKRG